MSWPELYQSCKIVQCVFVDMSGYCLDAYDFICVISSTYLTWRVWEFMKSKQGVALCCYLIWYSCPSICYCKSCCKSFLAFYSHVFVIGRQMMTCLHVFYSSFFCFILSYLIYSLFLPTLFFCIRVVLSYWMTRVFFQCLVCLFYVDVES